MNFFQILSEIEKVDPEVYDRLDSRRRVFKNMAGVGQKLTAAALPFFVGSIFNKVYAQTPVGLGVNDVLNFALKLEYLEMYFYATTNRAALTGLSTANSNALALIATDEANHVQFLRTTLGNAAIADPTAAQFDFTGGRGSAGGPFGAGGAVGNYRTNADVYLALAQAFEDTGVRAYKGAAPLTAVMANKTVLTAALNIHSIEARHASHIRSMRRGGAANSTPSATASTGTYTSSPKSWISGNDGGGPAPMYTAPVYNAGNDSGTATYGASNQTGATAGVTFPSEANTTQGGVALSGTTITAITFPTTAANAFSEAFDEGLDVGTVSTIARGFTIASSTLF